MPGKSILLIEFEPGLRDILSGCLGELGDWNVTLSSSIREALKLCGIHRPDVILLDASAIEDDVLILVEQLKQYAVHQAVPILLLSSKANWFTLKEFNQMGFCGAIGKPFNPSTLSCQVSRLIQSWHA
ncbi:response regulator [Leptolyngbya sp. KIOST-1]|uniref:response regulator n=1 Tax=Leptolyngbya sp. KIOST-1 TaxID=1229172 RepID=UPI00056105C5|nr:response regulator [Leptolyngbya sp. KIOST-1]